MTAAALLAEAIQVARQLQFVVREEDLEGAGGGHCSYGGKKWLLLDLTQSSDEQLSDAIDALRSESLLWRQNISPALADMLKLAKTA